VRDRGLTNIFRRRNRIGGITKQRMLSAAMLITDPMIVVNLPFLSSFYSKTSIPKEMEERRETLSISTHKKYGIKTYNIGRRGDIFVYIVTNHIFYQ